MTTKRRITVTLALSAFAIALTVLGQYTPPSGGGGGGATIPPTTDLIKGDNAGNGADSGIVPANVVQTNQTYANPPWITSLAASKVTGLSAPAYTTVSFSTTPTFTVGAATNPQNFQITLTGNVSSSTLSLTSATLGQDIGFKICLDSTPGRTFVWPANVINPGSIPTAASTCGKQVFRYDGTNAVAFGPMVSDSGTPGIQTPTGFLTLPTGSGTLSTGAGYSPYSANTAIVPLVNANWTTIGSGGTRTNSTSNGPSGGPTINIVGSTGGSGNVYGVTTTVAAGDFSHIVILWPGYIWNANFETTMIGFTDGTKVEACGAIWATNFGYSTTSTTALSAGSYNAANGQATTLTGIGINIPAPLIVQVSRTGTNLTCGISYDGGHNFTTAFADTTPFLTASSIIVYTDPRGSATTPRLTLISYN